MSEGKDGRKSQVMLEMDIIEERVERIRTLAQKLEEQLVLVLSSSVPIDFPSLEKTAEESQLCPLAKRLQDVNGVLSASICTLEDIGRRLEI